MVNIKGRAVLLLVLCTTVLFAGCSGGTTGESSGGKSQSGYSKDEVYKMYDLVQINDTKKAVDKALAVSGETVAEVPDSYNYVDQSTGFGVYVTFSDDKATSKTLIFPEVKDLAFLCSEAVTADQGAALSKDMTYDDVKNALNGEGIQRNVTSVYDGLSYMYYWVNDDGSLLTVVFGADGKMVSEQFIQAD